MTANQQQERRIDPVAWAQKINAKQHGVAWMDGTTHPATHGYYERAFTDGVLTQYWDGKSWSNRKGGSPHWRQLGDYPAWRGPGFPAATDLQTSEAESLAKRYSNGGRLIGGSALAELILHVRQQERKASNDFERAVSAYIDNYLLDELDDVECCVCGAEQHERLKAVFAQRDAIRALSQPQQPAEQAAQQGQTQ